MKVHWRDVVFAAVMILLFFAFLNNSFGSPDYLSKVGPNGEMRLCSEYLQQGTIFQGQPYCGQGISTYAFVLLVRILSGGLLSNWLYLLVLILLTLHALFLILRIVQNETGKKEYFLTGIFYFLTIYIFGGDLPSFLTAYFCITGFYVLWHSKLKFRNILGPVLYACALLSKPTAMPIVVFLLCHMVYRLFQPRIESKKLVFNNAWKSAGIRLLSFGLVLVAVFLIFPGSWTYEFGNQATYFQKSVFAQFAKLLVDISFNSGTMFFGLLFLLSVIAWYFLRDVYSSVAVFSIATLFWIFFNIGDLATGNGVLFTILRIDYFLAAFPFFIVAMAKLKHVARPKLKWIVWIFLALFLATSIEFIAADRDINSLEESFKNVLSLIPYQQDFVLAQDQLGDEILIDQYYDPNISVDIVPHNEIWKEGVFPDGFFYRQLEEINSTNTSDWLITLPYSEYFQPYDQTHNKTYNLFFSRLRNNSYSILIVNAQHRILLVKMIKQAPNVANYCQIMLPDLQYHTSKGAHGLTLLFRDKVRCFEFLAKAKKYYDDSFADICAKSPTVANEIVRDAFTLHKIPHPDCTGSTDSLLFLNRESGRLRIFSLLLGALLAWVAWIMPPSIISSITRKFRK